MKLCPRGPSPFVPGFDLFDASLENGITIRFARGGRPGGKTPLLMVHGHPHNHVIWRKVAPDFAKDREVILADLRGYGDSSKPVGDPAHRTYSKVEMAKDLALLMKGLGLPLFDFVGHDRGGRVGHRFALDYPECVRKAVFIDIAPTALMYARTNKEFATKYVWWFFLIQPAPFPERMIGYDPAYYLRHHIEGQIKIKGVVEDEVFAEYLRCYQDPAEIHAICEDYRAAATIDLEDEARDAEKRIEAPLFLLWGGRGTVGKLYDVVDTWRDRARTVSGHPLDCGHSPQEECPEAFLEAVHGFLDD